jgi:hypothetical protein
MLAALPESAEVDAEYTFAPTCLPTLKLLVDLKEPWGKFKEHFVLVLADGLQTAQIAPEILRFFNELIYGLLEIGIPGGYVEVETAKNVNAIFFPTLGEGDDMSERHDTPVLGDCLR